MKKPFYHVRKRTLLAIAGCVWLAAASIARGFRGIRADVL